MHVGESGKTRDLLVEARIVLHRARTERIDLRVDRIVVSGEADVMAHRLRFSQARELQRAFAGVRAQPRLKGRRLLEVDASRVETPGLEDQRLLDIERAVAGEGRARLCGDVFRARRAAL